MCKEINEELILGKYIATELVLHLLRMGANKLTIPIEVASIKYEVSIKDVQT